MSEKKFYWLKLKKDFFKRHDIKIIEDMENGKDYILFYLKLLCESLDHNGSLRFSDTIPYNEKMLSTITGTNIDIVRSAMKVFTSLEMIEILDDQTIYMREVEKMIGGETDSAERVRRHRALKQGQSLQCNAPVTICNEDIEIDIDRELKKEKEVSADESADTPQKRGEKRFSKPTVEEVAAYCQERNNNVDPQRFWNFYEAKGWKIGKSPMKDWKACVRTWEKDEQSKPPKKGASATKYDRREDE